MHLPKCGGTTLGKVLQELFKGDLHLHYPDDPQPMPEQIASAKNRCVHGHFYHHAYAISIPDYYPDAKQYITVVREPLDLTVSSWFYQRNYERNDRYSLEEYLEIVLSWKKFVYYRSLPIDFGSEAIKDQLFDKFVWVSTIEDMDENLNFLYKILDRSPIGEQPRLNSNYYRKPDLDYAYWRTAFQNEFSGEYLFYESIKNLKLN